MNFFSEDGASDWINAKKTTPWTEYVKRKHFVVKKKLNEKKFTQRK